jgi:hypothetical protein
VAAFRYSLAHFVVSTAFIYILLLLNSEKFLIRVRQKNGRYREVVVGDDSWQNDAANRTGIVVFEVNWSDAAGHFNLWNGTNMIDGDNFSNLANANAVLFWPLK